jgi:Ca2+-transporting ATPase
MIFSCLLLTSFAVAIVPESLPAVMTVILSIGVKHMARGKAIIRRLAAIEAIGNITLIATDKTGTITTNNMEVKEVWYDGKTAEVNQMKRSYHRHFISSF